MANSTYVVQRGDTLARIARAHGTSWARLARLNNISDPNRIRVGQVIALPESAEAAYIVKPGDTLGKIAKRLGTSVAALARANGIEDANRIHVGQAIRAPSDGEAPAPPRRKAAVAPPSTTAGSTHILGTLSARYETSGRGPGTVSTGRGDAGGVSYGSYQLASTLGRPEEFLAAEGKGWAAEFGGTRSGTPAFSNVWKAIAAREADSFHAAQHDYIKRTHYDPQVSLVRDECSLDIDARCDALKDVTWSTAVQHGPSGKVIVRAIEALGRPDPSDRDLIAAIYAERGRRKPDGNLAYFSKNSAEAQRGVAQRFRSELRDALAMLDTPGPPPSASSDNDWASLVERFGDEDAKADFACGRRVVIALRTSTNTRANSGRGLYDDRMIIAHCETSGVVATEFPGNTEPSGQYGWDGVKAGKGSRVDIDHDGKVDQGRLIAGNYRYERQPGKFLNAPFFKARNVQVTERDTDQDGLFTAHDPSRIDKSGAARSMYVHRGGNDNTWSAGCQTIPKSRYDAFLAALGDQKTFSYILIDQ